LKVPKTLGQILVEKNIITEKKLELALTRQKQEKGKYLGQILLEMGVPQDEINKALDSFNKRKPLGQILVDLKIITPTQLTQALQKQKELRQEGPRRPLGKLLVEMGHMKYFDYLQGLSKHFNMPTVSLANFLPSATLQKVLGEKYAQKHLILVLHNSAATIKLALAEPTWQLLEEIKKALSADKKIEFYMGNPNEIEACLKRLLDPFSITKYK